MYLIKVCVAATLAMGCAIRSRAEDVTWQGAPHAVGRPTESKGRLASVEILRKNGIEATVPAIVQALRSDERFQGGSLRAMAYRALSDIGGAGTPLGLEQFLIGLHDPLLGVQLDSASSLTLAPADKQPEVVAAFVDRLRAPETPANVKHALLHPVSKFGDAAGAALPEIEHIVRDRNGPEDLRMTAAFVLIRTGGPSRAMPVFREMSQPLDKAALLALMRFALETKGTLNADIDTRADCRKAVLEAIDGHADPDLRMTAVQALFATYGDDVYVERDAGFDLNPELRKVVERLARSDPDASLRKTTGDMLEQAEVVLAAKNAAREKK